MWLSLKRTPPYILTCQTKRDSYMWSYIEKRLLPVCDDVVVVVVVVAVVVVVVVVVGNYICQSVFSVSVVDRPYHLYKALSHVEMKICHSRRYIQGWEITTVIG